MSYFLIVFDNATGTLELLKEFRETQLADVMNTRFELERKHETEALVEVVVVGAPSIDAVRKTHGRYFRHEREAIA